jgi:hypothetical protein
VTVTLKPADDGGEEDPVAAHQRDDRQAFEGDTHGVEYPQRSSMPVPMLCAQSGTDLARLGVGVPPFRPPWQPVLSSRFRYVVTIVIAEKYACHSGIPSACERDPRSQRAVVGGFATSIALGSHLGLLIRAV